MIGDGLVAAGFITQPQMDEVLARQHGGDGRRFGEIAIALDYLSDEDMMAYLVQWAGGSDLQPDDPSSRADDASAEASAE